MDCWSSEVDSSWGDRALLQLGYTSSGPEALSFVWGDSVLYALDELQHNDILPRVDTAHVAAV